MNDLERTFQAVQRGDAPAAEFYRLMRESVLIFLMPYDPGGQGLWQVEYGSGLTFSSWMINGEWMLPIFTSSARMEESLRASGKLGENTNMAEMLGQELLQLLAESLGDEKVVINPYCQSGSRTMDLKLVEAILDGTALERVPRGKRVLAGWILAAPERQPARLREPLARFFRGLPEVKAAWLFRAEESAKPSAEEYVVALLVAGGEPAEVARETSFAIAGAGLPEWGSRVCLLDPKNHDHSEIMARIRPFYHAPDFPPPL